MDTRRDGRVFGISPQEGLVAIVDDDPTVRRQIRLWLEEEGYRTIEYDCGRAVLEDCGELPTMACVDLGLGDVPALQLLQHLKAQDDALSLIVVAPQPQPATAVAAMRAGAYDYVEKPLERDRLVHAARRAREHHELLTSVRRLENALSEKNGLDEIIGQSPPMQEVARQVQRVLGSEVAVCISGESGTGKELVANAIHAGGCRRRGPFVAISCGAIPGSLQESELFGHERGAFTGATQTRQGRFELASGGTLFLDEVGEMSLSAQAALLRTLQEKTVRRIGGLAEIPVDVRILCATQRDLKAEVEAGRFREDLYFRLVVYPIHVPPLRERAADIPLLVGHFLRKFAGREATRVRPDVLEALGRYEWPGNVRELENIVHRSLLSCAGGEITLADLPPDIQPLALPAVVPDSSDRREAQPGSDEIVPLRELERRAIARALQATQGSVGKAAKLLGIGRATLYRRLASEPGYAAAYDR